MMLPPLGLPTERRIPAPHWIVLFKLEAATTVTMVGQLQGVMMPIVTDSVGFSSRVPLR